MDDKLSVQVTGPALSFLYFASTSPVKAVSSICDVFQSTNYIWVPSFLLAGRVYFRGS